MVMAYTSFILIMTLAGMALNHAFLAMDAVGIVTLPVGYTITFLDLTCVGLIAFEIVFDFFYEVTD